jgi:hypothetical protein
LEAVMIRSPWLSLCVLLAVMPLSAKNSADALRQQGLLPTVVLTLVNNADVAADTLRAARSEVERIYDLAGIHLEWSQPGGSKQANTIHLTVVIVRNCVNRRTCENPQMGGLALGSEGCGARWAYVFFDRIRDLAAKSTTGRFIDEQKGALVLGVVIAHEVGHLLLPVDHGPSGLMASEINIAQTNEATRDILRFTPEQAVHMRNVVLNTSRTLTLRLAAAN